MFPQKIQKVDHQDRQANRDRLPVIQPVYRPIPLTATYGPKTLKPSELGSLFRPAKIIIAGHSFIPHLKDYMDDYFGPRHNMGLSYNSASVYFRGRGGHTISSFREEELKAIKESRPDIVHLELGTNDVSDMSILPETMVLIWSPLPVTCCHRELCSSAWDKSSPATIRRTRGGRGTTPFIPSSTSVWSL